MINSMISSGKAEKFSLWTIKGAIFLIPFLPLYVSTGLVFPYISGKNFAFRILVEFAAAFWIGLIYAFKEYRPRNSALTLSILVFTFIVGLADLLGVSPYNSFWSNYERMEGYITILHLLLYFMILKSVMRSRRDWMIYFNLFVVVSVFASIFALSAPLPALNSSQFAITYGQRIYGTIGNPPFLASYLLLSVFMAAITMFNTKRLYLKFIYVFVIIINSIAIYLTASRGAIIAAVLGAFMLVLFYIFRKTDAYKRKIVKKAAVVASVVLISFSIAFFAFRNSDFIQNDRTLSRFATMSSDPSVQNRFTAWKYAWEGIKERPFLGWGQENFIGVYTVNPIPFVREQLWMDRAHNIIVDWLVNAGILGMSSYLAIFVAAFYTLWLAYKKTTVSRREVFIFFTLLTVYFIHNLFTFDTINTYSVLFAVLAYIDTLDYAENVQHSGKAISPNNKKNRLLAVTSLFLLFFSFIFYFVNYKPIKESQLFTRIKSSVDKNSSFSKLLGDFDNALSLKTFGDDHVRRAMRSVSYTIIRKEMFKFRGAAEFVEKTIRELEKGIAHNRYDLQYLTDAINLYMLVAEYDLAFISKTEELITECIRLNREYQWLYMALADVYVLKKDYEGAFINVKKITDWDPLNDKKQLKLFLAAILASKKDVERKALANVQEIRMAENAIIESGRQSVFSINELYQIAQIYKEVKNFNESLHYLKEITNILADEVKLQFDPEDRSVYLRTPLLYKAQFHLEISKTYLLLGDKENSMKEAEKVKALALKGANQGKSSWDRLINEAEQLIYSLNK